MERAGKAHGVSPKDWPPSKHTRCPQVSWTLSDSDRVWESGSECLSIVLCQVRWELQVGLQDQIPREAKGVDRSG